MTYQVRKSKVTTNNKQKLHSYEIAVIRRTRGLSARIGQLAGFKRRSSVCDILSGRRPPSERFLTAMAQALLEDAHDRTTMAMMSRYTQRPQEAR